MKEPVVYQLTQGHRDQSSSNLDGPEESCFDPARPQTQPFGWVTAHLALRPCKQESSIPGCVWEPKRGVGSVTLGSCDMFLLTPTFRKLRSDRSASIDTFDSIWFNTL